MGRVNFSNEFRGVKLGARHVRKPWGRSQLPGQFHTSLSDPIGEVWFVSEDDSPLLAKYLFTGENLSVQVHPDDKQARSRGFASGKAECWFILDAEPGAVVGLGLRQKVTTDQLRCAAMDGSINELIAWRPVAAGDFIEVPPGTIHAIGAGISLLEIQQNSDVTYRLYDYGRGRQLHLDDGIAVAHCGRYEERLVRKVSPSVDTILVDGPHFTFVHSRSDALHDRKRLVLPIDGFAAIGDEIAVPGECMLVDKHQRLGSVEGRLLIAAAPSLGVVQLQVAA